jgi:hypothetical protein
MGDGCREHCGNLYIAGRIEYALPG